MVACGGGDVPCQQTFSDDQSKLRKGTATGTHSVLFVSRVEFIEAILSPAVKHYCPRDSVTILQYSQYSHSSNEFNVPFCGLIQGVSSEYTKHSAANCFYNTPCPTLHLNYEIVIIFYVTATLALTYTAVSVSKMDY